MFHPNLCVPGTARTLGHAQTYHPTLGYPLAPGASIQGVSHPPDPRYHAHQQKSSHGSTSLSNMSPQNGPRGTETQKSYISSRSHSQSGLVPQTQQPLSSGNRKETRSRGAISGKISNDKRDTNEIGHTTEPREESARQRGRPNRDPTVTPPVDPTLERTSWPKINGRTPDLGPRHIIHRNPNGTLITSTLQPMKDKPPAYHLHPHLTNGFQRKPSSAARVSQMSWIRWDTVMDPRIPGHVVLQPYDGVPSPLLQQQLQTLYACTHDSPEFTMMNIRSPRGCLGPGPIVVSNPKGITAWDVIYTIWLTYYAFVDRGDMLHVSEEAEQECQPAFLDRCWNVNRHFKQELHGPHIKRLRYIDLLGDQTKRWFKGIRQIMDEGRDIEFELVLGT